MLPFFVRTDLYYYCCANVRAKRKIYFYFAYISNISGDHAIKLIKSIKKPNKNKFNAKLDRVAFSYFFVIIFLSWIVVKEIVVLR